MRRGQGPRQTWGARRRTVGGGEGYARGRGLGGGVGRGEAHWALESGGGGPEDGDRRAGWCSGGAAMAAAAVQADSAGVGLKRARGGA